MTSPLITSQHGDVRWLRLHRPHRRNALDPELVEALDRAVVEATADAGTAIIVIAGDGPSFCAGADLAHLRHLADAKVDPLPFLTRVSNCFARIERAPIPVVAVVHGHVVAGGLELALACDVVVAERGTLIGDGHVRNGLLPAGGSSVRLPRKVGEALARWLILTGQLVPAEAFTASGFVHAIADRSDLPDAVDQVLSALRDAQGAGQVNGKRLLLRQTELTAEAALQTELDAFSANWNGPHVSEGLTRFANRGSNALPGAVE